MSNRRPSIRNQETSINKLDSSTKVTWMYRNSSKNTIVFNMVTIWLQEEQSKGANPRRCMRKHILTSASKSLNLVKEPTFTLQFCFPWIRCFCFWRSQKLDVLKWNTMKGLLQDSETMVDTFFGSIGRIATKNSSDSANGRSRRQRTWCWERTLYSYSFITNRKATVSGSWAHLWRRSKIWCDQWGKRVHNFHVSFCCPFLATNIF